MNRCRLAIQYVSESIHCTHVLFLCIIKHLPKHMCVCVCVYIMFDYDYAYQLYVLNVCTFNSGKNYVRLAHGKEFCHQSVLTKTKNQPADSSVKQKYIGCLGRFRVIRYQGVKIDTLAPARLYLMVCVNHLPQCVGISKTDQRHQASSEK